MPHNASVELFPRPKQRRPSNNVQPVFSPTDPFRKTSEQSGLLTSLRRQAQGQGGVGGQAQAGVGRPVTAGTIAPAPDQQLAQFGLPATSAPAPQTGLTSLDALKFLQAGQPGQAQGILRGVAGLPAIAPRAPTTGDPRDALKFLRAGEPGQAQDILRGIAGLPTRAGEQQLAQFGLPATGAPPPANGELGPTDPPNEAFASAARNISGAVAGNPFITASGKARLAAGGIPLFNEILPGFFTRTLPTIVQSMLGLFESHPLVNVQDLITFSEQTRPASFR